MMSARVFYFSGTGNSFIAARKAAAGIEGCIDPIAKYRKHELVETDEEVIGIVFPVYLAQIYGIPGIVKRFLEKLSYKEDTYYFILCTYGGYAAPNAYPAIKRCIKIAKARGGKIAGRFHVRFPMNNLDYDHIPVPIERNSEKILMNADVKLKTITEKIMRKQRGNIITQNICNITLGALLSLAKPSIMKVMRKTAMAEANTDLTYHQVIKMTDKSIKFLESKCISCGICAKVCPVDNIKLINGKPSWTHICEMCFACDEWCPTKAIRHWGKFEGKDYHHPSVQAIDIMRQKE